MVKVIIEQGGIVSEHMISGGQATFDQQVLQSDLPVLVDYWAEWCAPCKAMAPVLDEVVEEYRGRLRVVKVNVEQEPQIARLYGVRSQPTLMLFKNGVVEAQKIGVMSKSQLKAFIELNL